jgi:hypothetical protein
MSELIYIAIVAFVAYVAYTVLTDKRVSAVPTHFESADAPDSAAAESSAETPASPVEIVNASGDVKNPLTGEVAKIPNNYRFGKLWIKEALVSEGLLDRVYKNNELDNATNAKVQAALSSLRTMAKYQV